MTAAIKATAIIVALAGVVLLWIGLLNVIDDYFGITGVFVAAGCALAIPIWLAIYSSLKRDEDRRSTD